MTYASTVLTQELQRAVKNRVENQTGPTAVPLPPRSLNYQVSTQAKEYLESLRIYREQAKTVRVGRY
jgi:hypothetical protein